LLRNAIRHQTVVSKASPVSIATEEEAMKVTVIGRGNVGGGLARRWEAAGHEVTALGRDGGDASGSDVIVVAVPSNAIDDALERVADTEGTVAIDATNAYGGRDESFESLAHQVKARTNGPVSKAFNLNFAVIYDQIDGQRTRPSQLYCGDDDAREVTERLIRDAGYDPVSAGGLENARILEDFLQPVMGIADSVGGPFFYRFAAPGDL
jgi:8-hydroxy-5-deazaflavin:NADPH oxidoreductase